MTSARAELVTRRTYNREKADGSYESWEETVDRVIGHQRWLWERALTHKIIRDMPLHDVTADLKEWKFLNYEQEQELEDLRELMFSRKIMPAGRTLWLGGTAIGRRREASMFNCSHTEIETIYDVVDAFWLLLQGCGVGFTMKVGTLNGFRKPIKNIKVIRSKRTDKGGRETNEESFTDGVWTISVGDSAEAWAKSVGKLLAGKYEAHTLVLDFSEIRPAGERLKGYGWISSGDGPIAKAYRNIVKIMNKRAGNLLRKIDILDILNHLGTTLSSRRSAEIALCEYGSDEWYEFAVAKSRCYEDGWKHRQQSNNSLVFYKKPSRDELAEVFAMMVEAGGSEPGIINGQAALQRAPWFKGVNPCAEILLGNKSFCNLVEVDLAKFNGDISGLYKAMTLAARMNYRQTVVDLRDGVLQEAWHKNNEFLRLCGVGVTGIVQREDITAYEWKCLRNTTVWAAKNMAKELGLQWPKNTTTVKPSGTVSKIMDTTEGIHKPLGKYIFNWINCSVNDPVVKRAAEAGYRTLPNPSDDTSVLICMPIEWDQISFDKKRVKRKDGTIEEMEVNLDSAVKQLERYKLLQVNYCEQNVSNTISYDISEVDDIIDWLLDNWEHYVGVSFLFRADPTLSAKDLGFEYLPQEVVTEERYREYVETLRPIDWSNTDTYEELEDEGCATGACPIK
jgi:ribonucleoside-triphosphate reductase